MMRWVQRRRRWWWLQQSEHDSMFELICFGDKAGVGDIESKSVCGHQDMLCRGC